MRRFHHHGFDHGGIHVIEWLLPLLLVVAVAVLVVWAVRRVGGAPGAGMASAPSSRADAALEAVRLRYARGEIDRDAYVRLTTDLGGSSPPPEPPAPAS